MRRHYQPHQEPRLNMAASYVFVIPVKTGIPFPHEGEGRMGGLG